MFKLLRLLKRCRPSTFEHLIGSCGLHAVHGAVQFEFENKSAPSWDIFEFLRSVFRVSSSFPRISGTMRVIHCLGGITY